MNINEFTNAFFEFEAKHNYFDKKVKNLNWWDLVRHDLYYLIYYELNNIRIIEPIKRNSIFVRLIFRLKSKMYCYYIFCIALITRPDKIFLSFPRFSFRGIKSDYPIDYIVETYQNNKMRIDQSKFLLFGQSKAKISLLDSNELLERLNKHFNISLKIDMSSFINERISGYHNQLRFYKKIFKASNGKILIISQTGNQKGVFHAAAKNNLKTIEVQHGEICRNHPAYSYPKDIKSIKSKIYIPDFLFVYSEYFKEKEFFYPEVKRIVIGKYKKNIREKLSKTINDKYDLAIISANPYTNSLIEASKIISNKNLNAKILFKLHPNENSLKEDIFKSFKEYKNISIFDSEEPIENILMLSSRILVVQSTTTYSALESNKEIYILPKYDYHIHEDIFKLNNVHILDESMSIDLSNKTYSRFLEGTIFFDDFKISSDIKKLIEI